MQLHSVQRAPGKLKYLGGSESGMGAWFLTQLRKRLLIVCAKFTESSDQSMIVNEAWSLDEN